MDLVRAAGAGRKGAPLPEASGLRFVVDLDRPSELMSINLLTDGTMLAALVYYLPALGPMAYCVCYYAAPEPGHLWPTKLLSQFEMDRACTTCLRLERRCACSAQQRFSALVHHAEDPDGPRLGHWSQLREALESAEYPARERIDLHDVRVSVKVAGRVIKSATAPWGVVRLGKHCPSNMAMTLSFVNGMLVAQNPPRSSAFVKPASVESKQLVVQKRPRHAAPSTSTSSSCVSMRTPADSPPLEEVEGGNKKRPAARDFCCDDCGQGFSRRDNLARHARQVHGGEARKAIPYACPHCQRVYYSSSNRDRHIAHVHAKTARFVCDRCQTPFVSLGNLQRHLAQLHDQN
mmetsp:Transcript_51289/g.125936  ORF Transcript_51289/g.125936 Transcript_51289/m.125936 type:complete len:348 (+) Transcript_51289:175-1218(+)